MNSNLLDATLYTSHDFNSSSNNANAYAHVIFLITFMSIAYVCLFLLSSTYSNLYNCTCTLSRIKADEVENMYTSSDSLNHKCIIRE